MSTPVHAGQPAEKYGNPGETPVLPMSPVSTSTSSSNNNVVMVQPYPPAPAAPSPQKEDKMTVDACLWVMASFIAMWYFPFTGIPAFALSCNMLYKARLGEHAVARRVLDPVRLLTMGSFFIAFVIALMAIFIYVIILIKRYNPPNVQLNSSW